MPFLSFFLSFTKVLPLAGVKIKVGAAKPLTATADGTGVFSTLLPPMPPSLAAVSITVTSSGDTLELVDVVFGSVYVCSGQVSKGGRGRLLYTDLVASLILILLII